MSADSERALGQIYDCYLEFKGRSKMKKKHPAKREFIDIVEYVTAWVTTVNVIGEEAKTPQIPVSAYGHSGYEEIKDGENAPRQ